MNTGYTHTYARQFDGVRTAYFRALAASRLPEGCHSEECFFTSENFGHDPHTGRAAADVLWVHVDRITPLCQQHMDKWLDDIDTSGGEEPPALVPLRGRRRA